MGLVADERCCRARQAACSPQRNSGPVVTGGPREADTDGHTAATYDLAGRVGLAPLRPAILGSDDMMCWSLVHIRPPSEPPGPGRLFTAGRAGQVKIPAASGFRPAAALAHATSRAIEAALAQAGVAAEDVSEVILGQVLTAAQGQNPARQAAIKPRIGSAGRVFRD